MADGSERLPWLDEPRSQPAPRRQSAAPWVWAATTVALFGVGAGAYWLGTREPALTDAPSEQIAAAPPVYPPVVVPEQPPQVLMPEPELEPLVEAPPPPPEPVARPERRAARSEPADESIDEIVEEEEALAATNTVVPDLPASEGPPPITRPTPVIVRTPGRSWGRKVQLGAYRTQAQADYAWRALVRRYPYLATKPKLVSGVDVRSSDGRPTRMYRLQLATASQAQAVVICQQLQRAGQSCVVVY